MKKAKDSEIIKKILSKYDDPNNVRDVNFDKEPSIKRLNKAELIYLLKEVNKKYYALYHSDQWDGG